MARPGDVGAALFGVVFGQVPVNHLLVGAGERHDFLGEVPDGDFVGVADVDGAGFLRKVQPENAFNEVVYVAKASGLAPVSKHREVFSTQCLADECRQYAAVVESHARPVGIEDAHNARFQSVVPMIGHRNGFLEPFGFVVNASWANGVDMAEVLFVLGVHFRVAIDFAGGSDGYTGAFVFSQTKAIVHTKRSYLERLDGDFQVINGRRRRGKMQDVVQIALNVDVFGDVVVVKSEVRMLLQVGDVFQIARDEVVHGFDLETLRDEPVAEVGSEEARCTCDENPFH